MILRRTPSALLILATAVAVVAAAGVMASGADAVDSELVQPQQLIPDDPSSPETGGPLPPAFLPLLSTESIDPSSNATTPSGSSSSPAPASYASVTLTQSTCGGATPCTGFRTINNRDSGMSGAANSVVLLPAKNETIVYPMACGLYEIAKLRLTNGGLMAPTGARMITVPITTKVTLQTPGVNKSAKITLRFNVMWSLGRPAPTNQAGLFVLSTRNRRSFADFNLSMSAWTVFKMNIKVAGFTANPQSVLKGNVMVLGDRGQQNPAVGQPGLRVYVKQGSAQVVKLMACICKSDSLNPNCSQQPSAMG